MTEEGSSCGELVPAVVLSPSCTLSCCPATLASSEPGGAPDLGAAAIAKRSAEDWSQSYKLHTDLFNILDSILIRSKEERLGFHSPDPLLIRPSLLLLLLLSTPGTSLLGLWYFTNAVGCCLPLLSVRPDEELVGATQNSVSSGESSKQNSHRRRETRTAAQARLPYRKERIREVTTCLAQKVDLLPRVTSDY